MKIARRRFMSAATASLLAAPYILRGADAGRKYRTALIGCGWWGKNILKEAVASGRVQVTSLCDVDETALEVAGDQINDLSGDKPKAFKDFRELLEKDKPEIVIIATPDHWHALTTIAALKAGAHVYVEKPPALDAAQYRAVCEVQRRRTATQYRTSPAKLRQSSKLRS